MKKIFKLFAVLFLILCFSHACVEDALEDDIFHSIVLTNSSGSVNSTLISLCYSGYRIVSPKETYVTPTFLGNSCDSVSTKRTDSLGFSCFLVFDVYKNGTVISNYDMHFFRRISPRTDSASSTLIIKDGQTGSPENYACIFWKNKDTLFVSTVFMPFKRIDTLLN